jgi:hypothetical protein
MHPKSSVPVTVYVVVLVGDAIGEEQSEQLSVPEFDQK